MTVSPDVNFEELARSTDEFNGAQLKATCVEAGMIALREGASKLNHEHFLSGIAEGTRVSYIIDRRTWLTELYSSKQEEEQPHVLRIERTRHYSRVFFALISCTILIWVFALSHAASFAVRQGQMNRLMRMRQNRVRWW